MPVLELDVTDHGSVERVVARATVIANVVGPYARFGRHVYDVCAATGTHQVDVCGEIDWLAEQVGELHHVAMRTGSRIVAACGFESLPFDLVNLALARIASKVWNETLASTDVAIAVNPDPPVTRLHDMVSGGTVRSGTEALRRGAGSAVGDVRVLDPRPHDAVPLDLQPWQYPVDGRWLGPVLAHINPAIVHRTVGLLAGGGLFAEDFRYRDGLVAEHLVPGVPASLTAAWLAGLQVMSTVLGSQPSAIGNAVADGLEAFGPRPGEAPSETHLAGWTWRLDALGTTKGGHRVEPQSWAQGTLATARLHDWWPRLRGGAGTSAGEDSGGRCTDSRRRLRRTDLVLATKPALRFRDRVVDTRGWPRISPAAAQPVTATTRNTSTRANGWS